MRKRSERKFRFRAKLHQKKSFLHVHTSKELRATLTKKLRAILVNKGDKVKIMRGSAKGKTGKVIEVNHQKSRVYVEGVSRKTAKGKEVSVPVQPSNLLLIELNNTKDRKAILGQIQKSEKKSKEKITVEKPVHVEQEDKVIIKDIKEIKEEKTKEEKTKEENKN